VTAKIKRREFMALLGGAAAAWPLAARAQQPERVRLIGVLSVFAKDDPEAMAREAAFQETLADLGWTIGRNVRIDYRRTGGDTDSLRKYAAELSYSRRAMSRRCGRHGRPQAQRQPSSLRSTSIRLRRAMWRACHAPATIQQGSS
jgi:hypothetical protein